MLYENLIGIVLVIFILSVFVNFLYLLGNLFLLILNSNSEYNFDLITLTYGLLLYILTILFFLVFISILTCIYSIIINIYSYIKNKLINYFYERDIENYSSEKI